MIDDGIEELLSSSDIKLLPINKNDKEQIYEEIY